jgi:hypothetical protein
MPKYVIFNTINSDGIGDFSHMEDIVNALLSNPRYSDVEFIPIVCFIEHGLDSNYERIHAKMRAFNIPFFYGKNNDHVNFSATEALQTLLSTADQALIISFDAIFTLYEPYLKQGIPIKYIGEHENTETPAFLDSLLNNGRDWITHYKARQLGLSPQCHGIKIQSIPHMTSDAAWHIIAEHAPKFLRQLLICSHSSDIKTLSDTHEIIPAYFNRGYDFLSFLNLLGKNLSLTEKNIIVYHSGYNLDYFLDTETINNVFDGSYVKQLELINPKHDIAITLYANQQGCRTIKILSGFYLNDPAFDALYQLASVAGVSGDNTFERCISMDVLPYYWSTNAFLKMPTLIALQEITQRPELPLSQEARTSFHLFFDPNQITRSSTLAKDIRLNFPKMIEAWPVITAYLKQHKNFYNNLDRIILEDLPLPTQPTLGAKKSILAPEQIQHTLLGRANHLSRKITLSDPNQAQAKSYVI